MAEDLVSHLLSSLPPPLNFIGPQITWFASSLLSVASPIITILTRPLTTDPANSPKTASGLSADLVNAALLVFVMYMSLKILSMASRWLYSMVMTFIRLSLFTAALVLGLSLWNRGFEVTKQDILGWIEMVPIEEHWSKLAQASGAQGAGGRPRYSGAGGRANR